ncbi:MAG: hypothetical protein JJE47_12785 [Acidimicrobiia bacterium]|nr:hypothetical protein [Acidimicrobiia bacterium]
MIEELAVTNLGVIENARIEPGPGLVVITGETGTGKTLLAGAVGLLIGDPTRAGLIGPYSDEAKVEGRFLVGGEELVVSRRLVEGRSRAYTNGEMVPLKVLADQGMDLVEMVAQHDHLAIGKEASVLALVDRLLDAAGVERLAQYQRAWQELVDVRSSALQGDIRSIERARDLAAYEAGEIEASGFRLGEDDELHKDLARRRNSVELTEHLSAAHRAFDRGAEEVATAVEALRRVGRLDDELAIMGDRTDGVAAEVADLILTIRQAMESVDHDPERLEAQEARMALLGDLRRKYGDSLDEILAYGVAAQARAADLTASLEAVATFAVDLERAESAAVAAAGALREARQAAARYLCDTAKGHLNELGFATPHLSVTFEPRALRVTGGSHLTLLFASDDRLTPGPVNKVASGGELSRLVLALRLAGGVGQAPVVVFDEIDAGVGGRTALALGRKLAGLAADRQVFVVTHLPQVAAFADTHYVVERTMERADVRLVEGDARIDEIARMLAGLDDSQQGRDHAAELVATARRR